MWKSMRRVFGMGVAIACVLSLLPLPSVAAAPTLTVSPNSGIVGSIAVVNGTGFGSNVYVNIYWDSLTNLLKSVRTTTTGTFSVDVMIPLAVAGNHTIIARDVNSNEATVQFLVIPSLTISPTSGRVGDDVSISFMGFGAVLRVDFYWDGNFWMSEYTNNVGSRTIIRQLPELTGGYHVLSVVDENNNTASTQFLVFSTLTLNPAQGRYGNTVTFAGSGFGPSTDVKLYIDNQTHYLTSAFTNSKGSFSGYFTVPQLPGGTHIVFAVDSLGNRGCASFEILPLVRLSKYTGYVEDVVSVSGFGYSAGKSITVMWDGVRIPTIPSTVTVHQNGSFTCEIGVPLTPYGNHVVTAADELGLSHSVSFVVNPRIQVTPDHGLPGIFVFVNGTGFSAGASVSLIWDFGLPSQQGLGTTITNTTGGFNRQVQIPFDQNGVHTITAKDANWHLASATFYLGPSLSIANSSGIVGSQNTIFGYVFSPEANVIIYWDGLYLGNVRTDASGDFTFSFVIPHSQYGYHTISALDEYNVHAEIKFFVVPEITVLPDSGTVGSITTIVGTGFSGNSLVGIYWDGINTYRRERTNQEGTFIITFTVPEACFGGHTILAKDITGVNASSHYSVIPSIQLSRNSGYVGEAFKVFCYGFAPRSPVTLVWDGISTSYYSITTNAGFAEIQANVPTSQAGVYEVYVYDSMLNIVQPLLFTVLTLDAPMPLSPSGFVNNTSVMLSWSAVQNASFYIGQFSSDPLFGSDIFEFYTVSTNYWITGLIHGNRYYWRIKSVDSAGNDGTFSHSLSFTVDTVSPSSLLTGASHISTSTFTLYYTTVEGTSGITSVSLYYSFNSSDFELYAESTHSTGVFNFNAKYGDGTYNFYTIARDGAGNVEAVNGTKLTVILDTARPSAFVAPLPQMVNTSVIQLNVIYTDTGSGMSHFMLFYSTDNGITWEFYGNYTTTQVQFIAPSEGKYVFQAVAVDLAGNLEAMGAGESWTVVDLTKPVLSVHVEGTIGSNGWYTGTVKVLLNAEDVTSGVSAIFFSVDGFQFFKYTSAIILTEDGVHTISFYAVDMAGNIEQENRITVCIDSTSPETTTNVSSGWYSQIPVILELAAIDRTSGVATTFYRINEGEWRTGTVINLTIDGVYTVEFYSIDIAGNREMPQRLTVRIDTTAPVVDMKGVPKENKPISGTIYISFEVKDLSGVSKATYSIDGITKMLVSAGNFYSFEIDTTAIDDGTHTLTIEVTDNANHTTKITKTIRVDNTPPVISLLAPSERTVVAGEINIVVLLIDASNITEIILYLDNRPVKFERDGNTVNYRWKTTLADNGKHVLMIYVKDAAGNLKVYEHTLSVNNTDITPYIATLSLIMALAAAGVGLISLRKTTRLTNLRKLEKEEKVEVKEVEK